MIGQRRDTSGIPGRAVLAACLAIAAGCGAETGAGPQTIDTVQLRLSFGGGVTLDNIAYSLSGPGIPPAHPRIGTLPVGPDDSIMATFQNLTAGTGFDVKVQGTASDSTSICKGETMFDVMSGTNAVVTIALTCSGIAAVSADVNVCPTIDSLSANPAEVYVGSSLQLALDAHDPDNGPSPLTAAWSATSGMLSNLSTMGATFTCTAPGTFKIGVSVTDGTPQQKCADSASLNVVCTAVTP
jgi:hypothetical protein